MTNYEVGYRKPPKHTQFRKGQSGNPRGRPRGTRNLATDLSAELSEIVRVREDGSSRHISKQRALIKSLMAKALKGDARAAATVLALHARVVLERPASKPETLVVRFVESGHRAEPYTLESTSVGKS
jgi:hypothetical protein